MSQLVGLTAGQHFSGIHPESANSLIVSVYQITCRNFASKVDDLLEQETLSFEEQVMPAQFRSSILLVSGSCSVFSLHEPTGIGHWNQIPVPILTAMKASPVESWTRTSSNISQILSILGRTHAAITYIVS